MKKRFESAIGSLQWAANNTRPELSRVVSSLVRHSSNPTVRDYSKVIHCLGFVKATINRELVYRKSNNPGNNGEFKKEAFSDESFAPDSDVKLITGIAIYVNRNLVSWPSKKQKNITRNIAAEMVAHSDYPSALKAWASIINAVKIYEDNQAVLACCYDKSLSHTENDKLRVMIFWGIAIVMRNSIPVEKTVDIPGITAYKSRSSSIFASPDSIPRSTSQSLIFVITALKLCLGLVITLPNIEKKDSAGAYMAGIVFRCLVI